MKPVSLRDAAQARWVQQAISQRLGERVVRHPVTATTRVGTNVLSLWPGKTVWPGKTGT